MAFGTLLHCVSLGRQPPPAAIPPHEKVAVTMNETVCAKRLLVAHSECPMKLVALLPVAFLLRSAANLQMLWLFTWYQST